MSGRFIVQWKTPTWDCSYSNLIDPRVIQLNPELFLIQLETSIWLRWLIGYWKKVLQCCQLSCCNLVFIGIDHIFRWLVFWSIQWKCVCLAMHCNEKPPHGILQGLIRDVWHKKNGKMWEFFPSRWYYG